jgi:hypothetical protein
MDDNLKCVHGLETFHIHTENCPGGNEIICESCRIKHDYKCRKCYGYGKIKNYCVHYNIYCDYAVAIYCAGPKKR